MIFDLTYHEFDSVRITHNFTYAEACHVVRQCLSHEEGVQVLYQGIPENMHPLIKEFYDTFQEAENEHFREFIAICMFQCMLTYGEKGYVGR